MRSPRAITLAWETTYFRCWKKLAILELIWILLYFSRRILHRDCSVAYLLISFHKKKASSKVYRRFVYKVHIKSPYIQSSSIVHCIYHIFSPPSYFFSNACFAKLSRGISCKGWMTNVACTLFYLRSQNCPYYFLYCLDVYFLYSFLQNRYYQYLNNHPNH